MWEQSAAIEMQNMVERITVKSMAKRSVESGEMCVYRELGDERLGEGLEEVQNWFLGGSPWWIEKGKCHSHLQGQEVELRELQVSQPNLSPQ